jgi:hypothetical protein
MEGKASALAAAEALDHVSFLDREYAALQTVEPDMVRDAAARYLHPDTVSGVAYLPETEGPDLTPQVLEGSFALTALRESSAPTPKRPKLPPLLQARGQWNNQVLHSRLDGVDVLVRRKPGVPLVTLGVYVPRVDFDPPGKAGLGSLMVRSALRGAGDLDAGALAFAFERLGGTLSPSAASDWLGFGSTVLAVHLAEAAALLYQVFTAPHLGEVEVDTERGLMILEAEQVADDMFRYPFQLGFAAAFGEQ